MRKLMLPMMLADFKLMETWQPWGRGPAGGGAAAAAGAAAPPPQPACCGCFGGGGGADAAPPGMALPCPLAAFGAEYDNR